MVVVVPLTQALVLVYLGLLFLGGETNEAGKIGGALFSYSGFSFSSRYVACLVLTLRACP